MIFGNISLSWQVTTEGTYGEFNTPAGHVSYLMTKAKLGRDTSNASNLTQYLAPVREVLEIEEMDFNQLLQRDLDDYRVATELVDYLLKPRFGGPAFYTPILVALLPFDGSNPVDYYPEIVGDKKFKDSDGINWQQTQYSDAFRILKLATDETATVLSPIKLGRLELNTSRMKLVVIDGQHRAMALLAIRRTLDQDWPNSRGSRYRFFYENHIKKLLQSSEVDLNSIEFPVCIAWFPGLSQETTPHINPHKAARKLFVDVNQNARTPSKSRLILLSDTELIPIFIRGILNRLRQPNSPFPLHAIEYDYPKEQGEGAPVRPLAIASIMMLNNALEMALLAPDKYIQKVDLKITGRSSKSEQNKRLRTELELKNWLPKEVDDQGLTETITFEQDKIENDYFPRSQVEPLTQHFLDGWGDIILQILSNFMPFKCHLEALNSIENNWTVTADHGSLAKDAMFKGLGIYWTLKTDYEQWLEKNQMARENNEPVHEKTETGKAWDVILEKEKEFIEERTKRYFARKRDVEEELIRSSENIYATLRTQAFLSGAILTLASLKSHLGYDIEKLKYRASSWIESWNIALKGSAKRLYLFDRKYPEAFLQIPKLEPAFSIYFRYLILEMMASVKDSYILDHREREVIIQLLKKARKLYLLEIEKQELKELKRKEPTLSNKAMKMRAKSNSESILRGLCKTWFGITKDEFNQWLAELDAIPSDESLSGDNEQEWQDLDIAEDD